MDKVSFFAGAIRNENISAPDFRVLIFDATMWSFVDWTAAREILQIIEKIKALGVVVLLAAPSRKFAYNFFLKLAHHPRM